MGRLQGPIKPQLAVLAADHELRTVEVPLARRAQGDEEGLLGGRQGLVAGLLGERQGTDGEMLFAQGKAVAVKVLQPP